MGIERAIAKVLWRLLVWRGWAVQLNTPDQIEHPMGWRPLFSIRYGHQPVFRGPGEVRWRV